MTSPLVYADYRKSYINCNRKSSLIVQSLDNRLAYMETIQSRLAQARKESGLSQAAVAEQAGMSQPTYSELERGLSRSSAKLVEIAKVLGVNPIWLATGKGQMRDSDPQQVKEGATRYSASPVSHENVEPIGYHNNDMPLISFVKAGSWCESPDNFAPGDAEEWLPRPRGVGPRAFALRVEGDSMTSPYPGQRSYPDGAIIYVDPDRALTNGARVIARTPDGEYTFKVYTEDAGRRYLKPINPQYPMIDITEDTHICGVVAGSYIPE